MTKKLEDQSLEEAEAANANSQKVGRKNCSCDKKCIIYGWASFAFLSAILDLDTKGTQIIVIFKPNANVFLELLTCGQSSDFLLYFPFIFSRDN